MGSYNIKSIRKKIAKSRAFSKAAGQKMNRKLTQAKALMLAEFDNHSVTKELSMGESAKNLSGTLNGYGNLFTFIGFPNGYNPISSVRETLVARTKIISSKSKRTRLQVEFVISLPSYLDLRSVSQMPWEMGRSWLEGIENGISGFSNYMYTLFNSGRSKMGVQIDNKIRSSSHTPTGYLTPILRKFIINMQ